MEGFQQLESKKYNKIDLETRKKLVHDVLEDDRSLSKTANKLGIKLSTAKAIVKRYKEEGSFFETKREREQRLMEEENLRKALYREQQEKKAWSSQVNSTNMFLTVPNTTEYSPAGSFPFFLLNISPLALSTWCMYQNI